jgi:hypothetical protein
MFPVDLYLGFRCVIPYPVQQFPTFLCHSYHFPPLSNRFSRWYVPHIPKPKTTIPSGTSNQSSLKRFKSKVIFPLLQAAAMITMTVLRANPSDPVMPMIDQIKNVIFHLILHRIAVILYVIFLKKYLVCHVSDYPTTGYGNGDRHADVCRFSSASTASHISDR